MKFSYYGKCEEIRIQIFSFLFETNFRTAGLMNQIILYDVWLYCYAL